MNITHRSVLGAWLVLAGAGLLGCASTDGRATTPPGLEPRPLKLASIPSPSAFAQITSTRPVSRTRAGSGLVRYGERLLLAQDDAYMLVWLDPRTTPVRTQFVALARDPGPLPKAKKPDFEAATLLPDGRLLVMGSGSAPTRRSFVLLDPQTGEFVLADAGPVYAAVATALGGELNIEGVIPEADGLILFNRGSSAGDNAVIGVALRVDAPTTVEVKDLTRWHLGEVQGFSHPVALAFTDATRGPDGQLWYLAAAEDTPDAISDGQVVGAVIGVLGAESGSWTPILESDGTPSVRKFEGLVIDADGAGGWLVTDADSPEQPTELCRIALRGLAAAK